MPHGTPGTNGTHTFADISPENESRAYISRTGNNRQLSREWSPYVFVELGPGLGLGVTHGGTDGVEVRSRSISTE